jgi:membrane protein implicated in regulation of membrane protease activity
MLVRLVPLAILAWAIAGAAFGLIVDLPVFFRVCALIAVAALPLVLLMLWLEFASRRGERDELSRE